MTTGIEGFAFLIGAFIASDLDNLLSLGTLRRNLKRWLELLPSELGVTLLPNRELS
jgi:hypothetical protein